MAHALKTLPAICAAFAEGGFRIDKDFRDRWCFLRPDGIALPDCGYHAFNAYDAPPAGGLLGVVEKILQLEDC